ncbi:MAG: methyltransferase domain-containing protein [Planctomycetia bacterium]|nr:methyltransferase domain-containing protein [Planctomycetia bacterium]
MNAPRVTVYSSLDSQYHHAFQVFLDHTDQKTKALAWLENRLASLPERRVLIDAGAGTGQLTAWVGASFERVIAIEPNASLREDLRKNCPRADISGDLILAAQPALPGDFVLCSHVFYYLEADQWLAHLEKLASWLSERGVLAVALQNSGTDCQRMIQHFLQQRFDLAALGREFEQRHGNAFEVQIDTVEAWIATPAFAEAYIIAEFMLNLLPMPNPPERQAVEDYVRKHFQDGQGGYRFSCHQDFLQVQRRK